jgi:hypothetical protein
MLILPKQRTKQRSAAASHMAKAQINGLPIKPSRPARWPHVHAGETHWLTLSLCVFIVYLLLNM